MKTSQKMKLQSIQRTNEVLESKAAVFDGDGATLRLIARFREHYLSLTSLAEAADVPTQWITREKDLAKTDFIDNTYPLSVSVVRYANDTGSEKLIDLVRIRKSHLKKMCEMDLLNYGKNLVNVLMNNAEALVAFSITAEQIEEYKSLLQNLETKIAEREMLLGAKKKASDEFDMELKQTNLLLKSELDWAIEGYLKSQPEMVNLYFTSRKVAKISTRHADVRGYVKDKGTGEPVSLGKVTVEGLNLSANITAQGMFVFKTFPEGEFTLKVENIGYKPQLITIRRYQEQRTKINVLMEPLPLPHPGV